MALMPDLIAQPHHISFEPLCIYEIERDGAIRPLPGRTCRCGKIRSFEDAALPLPSHQAGADEKAHLVNQTLAEEQPVQCSSRINSHHFYPVTG